MSDANQIIGEIRSASAGGDFDEALRLVERLPEHMRAGVREEVMREHQLETCTVCEGEGGWEVSFGWGEGEGCDRYIPCSPCAEHGTTTPGDREAWRDDLAKGVEAQEKFTELAEEHPDFWCNCDL